MTADAVIRKSHAKALRGAWLSLYRIARAMGVWRFRDSFNWRVRHRFSLPLPFFDPLDASHLIFSMSKRIASDARDHHTIGAEEFESWLIEGTRTHPDFQPHKGFADLTRSVSVHRARQVAGPEGIGWVLQGIPDQSLVVDVYWRRGVSPQLSRGQYRRVSDLVDNAPKIDAAAIAAIWKDVLACDWPDPLTTPPPPLRPE